ncbi:MAG: SPASM domain-containing protein, partial [Candidatus Methanoperedens sp.]
PPAQVKEVIQYLHEMRGKTRLDFVPFEFEEMLDGGVCPDPPAPDQPLQCGGAVAYATITPAGEVLPCHFFEGVRADSVKSDTFRDVWYRSRFLNYFRHLRVADLHGNCSTCTWLPRCAGSCRAVNFAKGDLFGGNKACWVSHESLTGEKG